VPPFHRPLPLGTVFVPLLVRSFDQFVRVRPVAWLRLCALVLASVVVWLCHYERWTWESWQVPTDYSGDSLEILARIEAAAAGETLPLRPQMMKRLGAPFGANWSAYPASDLPLVNAMGFVARFVGVNVAANFALLLASVTAAVSFYGCARFLRWRWEWAFATALVFAFTFQSFGRGLPHLMLAFSWTVPLALLTCALVAGSRRIRLRSAVGVGCLVVAFALGVSNPYNLFFYLQLMLWALLLQLFGRRRQENLAVGLASMAVAVVGLGIMEAPTLLYTTDKAANSPLVRNYGGTERYALKPIELFLPPSTHRSEQLAFFGHRYLRWSEWRGEAFAPYLGVVGIVALIWLAYETLLRVVRRRGLPGGALPALWVVAFASLGGVTNIVAFFTGLHVFRATNRFSIFLSAIVLLFLAARLSRVSMRWPRWASVTAALLVGALGVWEEVPRKAPEEVRRLATARLKADREFGGKLEATLPPRAMIFQLPVVVFPEAPSPHAMSPYDHFRPYLATHDLRFTYGALRGRARGRWQREMGALPAAELVRKLERYGFAGLYINRDGYADRGEELLANLARLGRTEVIEDALKQQVFVRLRPLDKPRLPIARGLTPGHGWHQPPANNTLALPRWAWGQTAALSYFNPFPHPVTCSLKMRLSSAAHGDVALHVNGRLQLKSELHVQPEEILAERVTLQPGANYFEISTSQPPRRSSEASNQLRSFALHQSEIILPDDVPGA
jgi:hypothetical protein